MGLGGTPWLTGSSLGPAKATKFSLEPGSPWASEHPQFTGAPLGLELHRKRCYRAGRASSSQR